MKAQDLCELRARAQAFALGAAAEVDQAGDEDGQAKRALALLAAEGWLEWTVPAKNGGKDTGSLCSAEQVSAQALCAIRSGLAFGSGMLDVIFIEQGLGSYPIAMGGTSELRAKVLPRVARGEHIAAFALTEEGAGSDVSGVALRATQHGNGWQLKGAKTLISNAGLAHGYTLVARTEGEPGDREGLSMFYVPADVEGLSVSRFEVMAPHPIGEVHLDGVQLGQESLLGPLGGGMELALGNLARFRTSVAAAANGFAGRALTESAQRLQGRQQFGRPLSSFQGLRFDLAEMDVRLAASEQLVTLAAKAVDGEQESTAAVARAKLFATEAAGWICDRAVQHFGGMGVRRGQIVERLYREVRALRIYEGTSEVQKLILAKDLLRRCSEQSIDG